MNFNTAGHIIHMKYGHSSDIRHIQVLWIINNANKLRLINSSHQLRQVKFFLCNYDK